MQYNCISLTVSTPRHLILVHKISKSAKEWREDIICTAKSENENHVQKLGEEEVEEEKALKVHSMKEADV